MENIRFLAKVLIMLFLMTDLREFSGEILLPFTLSASPPAPPPPPQLMGFVVLLPFLVIETSGDDELILLLNESGKTFSKEVASARIFDLESGFL